jgi:hypothetical protein
MPPAPLERTQRKHPDRNLLRADLAFHATPNPTKPTHTMLRDQWKLRYRAGQLADQRGQELILDI